MGGIVVDSPVSILPYSIAEELCSLQHWLQAKLQCGTLIGLNQSEPPGLSHWFRWLMLKPIRSWQFLTTEIDSGVVPSEWSWKILLIIQGDDLLSFGISELSTYLGICLPTYCGLGYLRASGHSFTTSLASKTLTCLWLQSRQEGALLAFSC